VALVALVATSAWADQPPLRRRVHVDHLDAKKVEQYVRARRAWVASVASRRAVDPWGGTFLQVGGSTFLTVRAFDTFAELDVKPAPGALDAKAQAAYNRDSDDALVPPHHSELWVRDADGDLGEHELAGVGRIVFEQRALDTTASDEAWAEIRGVLTAKYPLRRLAFFSQYGSGRSVTLWLAPDEATWKRAPTVDQVLVEKLGKAKAAELLARWRGATTAREELELVVRADLSN
jgi:hypothetical protein